MDSIDPLKVSREGTLSSRDYMKNNLVHYSHINQYDFVFAIFAITKHAV